jgi:hypothetical protein
MYLVLFTYSAAAATAAAAESRIPARRDAPASETEGAKKGRMTPPANPTRKQILNILISPPFFNF